MMPIPNWLQPTDTLAAISRGAAAGSALREQDIQTRAQDIAASEAADRLRQSYDLMAQHQAQFEAEQRAHATDAAARLAEQSANIAMQAGWHRESTDARKAADALLAKHRDALEEVAKGRFELAKEDAKRTADMTSFGALPVLDPEGNQVGLGVPGAKGAYHPIVQPKTLGATPTAQYRFYRDQMRDIDNELKNIGADTAEAKPLKEQRAALALKAAAAMGQGSALMPARFKYEEPTDNPADALTAPAPEVGLPAMPTPRTSQGGYKMGKVYGGLRYLGGDPNDESNWEPK